MNIISVCSLENWLGWCDFLLTHFLNIFFETSNVTCMSLFTRGVHVRVKMPFSVEYKHTVKLLSLTKHLWAKYLMSVFPNKQWSLDSLKNIKDVDELRHFIADECDKLDQRIGDIAVYLEFTKINEVSILTFVEAIHNFTTC